MSTLTSTDPAALARELTYLVDLRPELRGPAECERYEHVWAAATLLRGTDRAEYYAEAVAAIDPTHTLGPYLGSDPSTNADLTMELYVYETKRLNCVYRSEEPISDLARRLLVVTDPLFHSYSPEERYGAALLTTMLACGQVTADDFPGFDVRDYVRRGGADLAAWDAAARRWAELEEAAADGSLDLSAVSSATPGELDADGPFRT